MDLELNIRNRDPVNVITEAEQSPLYPVIIELVVAPALSLAANPLRTHPGRNSNLHKASQANPASPSGAYTPSDTSDS